MMGHEEFLFYVDGKFQSRGGYFTCWGMWSHAMPACYRTSEHAIVATTPILNGSVLPAYNGLSGWLIKPIKCKS